MKTKRWKIKKMNVKMKVKVETKVKMKVTVKMKAILSEGDRELKQ